MSQAKDKEMTPLPKPSQSQLTRIQSNQPTAAHSSMEISCNGSSTAHILLLIIPYANPSAGVFLDPKSHREEVHSSPADGNSEVTCCGVVPETGRTHQLGSDGVVQLEPEHSVEKESFISNWWGCCSGAVAANFQLPQCLALSQGGQCWNSPIPFIESHIITEFQWFIYHKVPKPQMLNMEVDSSNF